MSPTHDPALHPLLRTRYSPLAFDSAHVLARAEVDLLLEAARWAPSAGNAQPWAFVIGRRGDRRHTMLLRHLAPSASRWAGSASALVVNIVHAVVDDSELVYSEFADYDLGQAVAHMSFQAQAMDLATRQFRAFDLDGLSDTLALAPGWRVRSMTAVGRAAGVPPDRARRDRTALVRDALTGE